MLRAVRAKVAPVRWWSAFCGVAVSSVFWVAVAFAQGNESPLELTWHAPPGCPDGPAVHAEVIRLARVDSSFARRMSARVTVEKPGALRFARSVGVTIERGRDDV